jgi:hypothetical protein
MWQINLAILVPSIHSKQTGKHKVKVKTTLEQAIKAQKGSRGRALLFNHGTRLAILPSEKET